MDDDPAAPTEAFFDAWAPFYDLDYRDQAIGDVSFYVDLAREADGPVLEVGCGTGRIYLDLLRAGVDAHGIDVSRNMLAELERKARAADLDPRVRVADMRTFDADREYALVVVPFRAFLHNVTLADQKRALRSIREALAPTGRLALNFFAPSAEIICETYGQTAERTVERDGEAYTLTDRSEFEDELARIVRGERTVRNADDEVIAEGSYRIKLVTRDEFELLLETTGYADWEAYGGFDYDPLESVDQEMVWLVER